ncbi:MAG: response regulator, partial [Actinomycetota bacterium]
MLKENNGRASILIVDDESVVRNVLHQLLSESYQCVEVASAEEALTRLRAETFNLVISDIKMTGISGLELAPQVRELAPETIVIMISGMQNIENAIKAMRLGVFDYITKPFAFDHIEAVVKRALEHQALQLTKKHYENHLEELVAERTAKLLQANEEMQKQVEERHRAENKLSEAKQFLYRVIDNVPNLIFVKDKALRYVLVNQAFASVYEMAIKDVIGKTDEELIRKPEDLERYNLSDRQVLESNQEFVNLQDKFIDSDGITHWMQTVKRPMLGKSGVEYILAIATDLTELKTLEYQLHQAQKLESIGQLAAGIAHEINTPTQYVGDNTKFLQDGFEAIETVLGKYSKLLTAARSNEITNDLITGVDNEIKTSDLEYFVEEVPKAVQQSLEGISRIAKIVQSMKDFAHPGSKEKCAADLNKAIESTITVAQNEWKYVAELETNFDKSLPHVPCLLGEFNQVILNMIINASHAIAEVIGDGSNGKGKITVSTSRVNDDWAEIRITDTGGGIPIEAQNKVFNPFFTTKEVGKGTGQGLAISYTVVVEKHKGKLNFETESGKGTTFIIQLPLTDTNSGSEGLP